MFDLDGYLAFDAVIIKVYLLKLLLNYILVEILIFDKI